MTLTTVKVLGADGTQYDVAGDLIGGVFYPANKLFLGSDGEEVTPTNPLPSRDYGGFVSTTNSTSATLAAGGNFTGPAEDVTHYASVSVSWNSDVAGSVAMEFSTDGTNWDRSVPVSSHTNGLQINHGGVHRLAVSAKFFRIVYTNGSISQGFLRLQTIFHTGNSLPLISRIEQQLDTSTDCSLIRPVSPIELDLARRQITGQRAFFFFGFNNVFPANTWENVHPSGGNITWLTTPTKVEVLSSHADDNSSGIGTRSVEVHGLAADGTDQDEVILLNGTTPVESQLTYTRVNKMHNEVVGTYGGSHKGDITCRPSGGGANLSLMTGVEGAVDVSAQYGSGEAGNGYYSVPLGKVLYITSLDVFINSKANQTADIVLYEREGILNTSGDMDPRRVIWSTTEVTGEISENFKSHIKIKNLTDLFFRAQGSGTGTKISVHLEFYLVDKNAAGE